MIELQFTGMCKDCVAPNLELSELVVEDFFGSDIKQYQVRCLNEPVCRVWENTVLKERAKVKELENNVRNGKI